MRLGKWREKQLSASCRTVSDDTESEMEETATLRLQLNHDGTSFESSQP